MFSVRVVEHGALVVSAGACGASGGRQSAVHAGLETRESGYRPQRRALEDGVRSWDGPGPGHAETNGLVSVFVSAVGEGYTENVHWG